MHVLHYVVTKKIQKLTVTKIMDAKLMKFMKGNTKFFHFKECTYILME